MAVRDQRTMLAKESNCGPQLHSETYRAIEDDASLRMVESGRESRRWNPTTKQFETSEWPALAAEFVQRALSLSLDAQRVCNIMLTGGRSAERLYLAWRELPAFWQLKNVNFFFGDERCVSPDDPESNYGMAMRTLFGSGVPSGCSVFRMAADDTDIDAAAWRYGELLPSQVDILLLGVGADGHVASLFPGSVALRDMGRLVVPVRGPIPPFRRLTIGPDVVTRAKSIIVLACGVGKKEILARAIENPNDIDSLPARMALRGTWLLDNAA